MSMSKEDLRKLNVTYRVMMLAGAAALAICAMIYNKCHLFTAAVWAAYALESGFVINKDGGVEYE